MDKYRKLMKTLSEIGPVRIALLALAGVILLVTGIPRDSSTGKKQGTSNPNSSGLNISGNGSDSEDSGQEIIRNEEYATRLENKLKYILEHVDGVGRVEVMITLKSSEETILNKDVSREETTDQETGEKTDRSESSIKRQEETILNGGSGAESPYVVKRLTPEIAGVLITCEGAGSNQVTEAVIQAAEAVFDIPSGHIKVLKMEADQ